jgi:hypothetical protein
MTVVNIFDRNATRSLPADESACHCCVISTTLDRFAELLCDSIHGKYRSRKMQVSVNNRCPKRSRT